MNRKILLIVLIVLILSAGGIVIWLLTKKKTLTPGVPTNTTPVVVAPVNNTPNSPVTPVKDPTTPTQPVQNPNGPFYIQFPNVNNYYAQFQPNDAYALHAVEGTENATQFTLNNDGSIMMNYNGTNLYMGNGAERVSGWVSIYMLEPGLFKVTSNGADTTTTGTPMAYGSLSSNANSQIVRFYYSGSVAPYDGAYQAAHLGFLAADQSTGHQGASESDTEYVVPISSQPDAYLVQYVRVKKPSFANNEYNPKQGGLVMLVPVSS